MVLGSESEVNVSKVITKMAPNVSSDRPSEAIPPQVMVRRVARVILMLTTIVVVIKFQVNRPKSIYSYHTSDPWDDMRNGLTYTCGCSLPPELLGKDGFSSKPDAGSDELTLQSNRCFDSSELENVDILVYPQFFTIPVERVLGAAYPLEEDFKERSKSKTVEGLEVVQQGRTLSWSNNDRLLDSFTNSFKNLFPNDPREVELAISTNFTENRELLDFPSSYIAISFAFRCTNCTLCPLSQVNEIVRGFDYPSQHEPWGNCTQLGSQIPCTGDKNSYEAKCVLYPTSFVPVNFALQTFLRKLQEIPGIENITPLLNRSFQNKMSLTANMLYMNFSRVRDEKFALHFFEVPKESTAYSNLLGTYPDMDLSCGFPKNVTVCNGTSVCNLFKITKDDRHALMCFDQKVQSECRRNLLMNDSSVNVTVDNPENLWGEFVVRNGDFADLMCMNYSCATRPDYLVSWQIAPKMLDPLDWLLQSSMISTQWSRASGMCTQTYRDVIRYRRIEDGQDKDPGPLFLKANCSQNAVASHPRGYCWLTGEFFNFKDDPITNISTRPKLNFSNNETLFVCYHVGSQNFFVWLIVSFGVIFGWLGSMDMLLSYILFPVFLRLIRLTRSRVGKDTGRAASDESSESDEQAEIDSSLKSQDEQLLNSGPDLPELQISKNEAKSQGTPAYRRYWSASALV